MIPKYITVNGAKFTLRKQGTKQEVEHHKHDIIDFNRKERIRCDKSWASIYKFRVRVYGSVYAIFTH